MPVPNPQQAAPLLACLVQSFATTSMKFNLILNGASRRLLPVGRVAAVPWGAALWARRPL
jgi:hypothetical protein